MGISVIVDYLSLASQHPFLLRVLGWVAIVIGKVTFFYPVFTKLLSVPLHADLLFRP